jgi:hypothetical protein
MYLFHVFRSFQPLLNPIGFGAGDFIELAVAAILVSLTLARARLISAARMLAERTGWSMLFLAVLPVALRLALFPHSPAPVPSAADDTSYLLLADTLSHFRLANPTHLFHRFFESTFILQEPTYGSIFPLGQGIFLALGRMLFGHPWAGVLLSEAGFSALCYWMLRGWMPPVWALVGGLLAVFEFGPLTYWMNSYWGGAVSAMAGCLVFGSLPRLQDGGRGRDAVLLGVGLGAQLLTRPYEGAFLILIAVVWMWGRLPTCGRLSIGLLLPLIAALALTLSQNKAVTGSWTTLPYQLSRSQYGVPTTFTAEPNPVPQRGLTYEQQLDYQAQTQIHDTESHQPYAARLAERVRYGRFFLLPSLYVALPALLLCLRERRLLWVIGSIALLTAAVALYPYFYPHYIAAVTCLFVLLSVKALSRLPRPAAALLLMLAVAHFVFWYGVQALGDPQIYSALTPYESWDFINRGDPEGRIRIMKQLAQAPGKHLIFVRYGPLHPLLEWVSNAADIDQSRLVWALDLGAAENEKLRQYYPDRTAWLVEPDALPPRLTPMSTP